MTAEFGGDPIDISESLFRVVPAPAGQAKVGYEPIARLGTCTR